MLSQQAAAAALLLPAVEGAKGQQGGAARG